MSKKNEQTMQQPVDATLEKTPAQAEVLELDETMLDIVNGGIEAGSNKGCGIIVINRC